MSEIVSLSPDGACILVHSSGPPSLEEMQRTLATIAALRREHGIDRVLVDSRGRTGQPPVSDIIEGGKRLVELLGAQVRVAILVRQLEDGHLYFRITAAGEGGRSGA